MARRSRSIAYGLGDGVVRGDSIQKAMVPRMEFKSGTPANVIWLATLGSKLITPVRPSWLATQVAPTFTPLWFALGEPSTITSPCGAASNAKCTTNSGRTVRDASAEVTLVVPR